MNIVSGAGSAGRAGGAGTLEPSTAASSGGTAKGREANVVVVGVGGLPPPLALGPAPAAWGHSGAGGSVAFFCERSLSGVAIVVNQLSVDNRASCAVLALLARELGISDALSSGF